MPTYGLSDSGFLPKSLEVVKAEIETKWRTYFGASLDLSSFTPDGQLIGIFAEREALLWELAEVLAGMMDRDKASGALLDAACLLTGTYREAATRSAVTLTLTGTNGTAVSVGSQVATASTAKVFATLALATLANLTAWVVSTAYAVGDRRSANGNAYVCVVAGTSNATGTGPIGAGTSIVDGVGALRWRYMGAGTAVADAAAAAVDTGPTLAVSGDLNVIKTPVAGWSSVINLLDANPGSYRTSDQGLRLLAEAELAASGASPVPAIRRALLRVDDVESVTVFYNNTDFTDVDGLPPHSVEAMVQGGDNTAIAKALLNSVAGGVAFHSSGAGAVSTTVIDSEGRSHVVKFSRPVVVPIYIIITVEIDATKFTTNGADLIKAAIVAWGGLQNNGRDARSSAISKNAFVDDSVVGVTTCLLGTAPAPTTSATVVISLRQLATYDTSRITVITTSVTP